MLTIKDLKILIDPLPDEAEVNAYEGEGIGLNVWHGKRHGWIETGHDEHPADGKFHDLSEFTTHLEGWLPPHGSHIQ